MFGAPSGALTPFGKSGVESAAVRPILPLNGAGVIGRTDRSMSSPACAPSSARTICGLTNTSPITIVTTANRRVITASLETHSVTLFRPCIA
jgi:hypothetical protein